MQSKQYHPVIEAQPKKSSYTYAFFLNGHIGQVDVLIVEVVEVAGVFDVAETRESVATEIYLSEQSKHTHTNEWEYNF
jgi:hypothetical protein